MTGNSEVPEIRRPQLDAVLKFLPIFEQPGYVFGEWHSPEGQFPYYSMSREVMDFIEALSDQEIIFSFDWPSWQEEAVQYVSDPGAVEQADLLTLRKLLTLHVRKDRFVEGHLAHMLEDGHITAVLRQLNKIREQMARS